MSCTIPGLSEVTIPEAHRSGGFAVGCQAYTFNQYTVFEAIEKTAQAGGKVIEFYPGQRLGKTDAEGSFGHDSSPEIILKVKAKLAEHGMMAVNYGVVSVPRAENQARKIFDFAKTMGMRAITTESVDAIDTLETLAKEYDIQVAFHNHPRRADDPNYKVWDPNYIRSLVENRDRRLGACADTGHWVRSGLKPLECLQILKGRVASCHLKDLNVAGPDGHDVPFGTGVSGIGSVLDELRKQGFQGNIAIEYQHNWTQSVPEVAQCIGFVRGYGMAR